MSPGRGPVQGGLVQISRPTGIRASRHFFIRPLAGDIARRGPDVLHSVTGSCGGSVARMIGSHDKPIGRVVNVSSIVAGDYAENELRKDFTPMERVAIGKTLEKEIGKRQGQRTDQLQDSSPEVQAPKGQTRDIVARQIG